TPGSIPSHAQRTESMSTAATSPATPTPAHRVVHRRHWLAWAFGALVVVLLAILIAAAINARILDLKVVGDYIFSPRILTGAINSILLGTTALVIAVLIGLVIALMRVSGNPILIAFSSTYVYLFRGTPM